MVTPKPLSAVPRVLGIWANVPAWCMCLDLQVLPASSSVGCPKSVSPWVGIGNEGHHGGGCPYGYGVGVGGTCPELVSAMKGVPLWVWIWGYPELVSAIKGVMEGAPIGMESGGWLAVGICNKGHLGGCPYGMEESGGGGGGGGGGCSLCA